MPSGLARAWCQQHKIEKKVRVFCLFFSQSVFHTLFFGGGGLETTEWRQDIPESRQSTCHFEGKGQQRNQAKVAAKPNCSNNRSSYTCPDGTIYYFFPAAVTYNEQWNSGFRVMCFARKVGKKIKSV